MLFVSSLGFPVQELARQGQGSYGNLAWTLGNGQFLQVQEEGLVCVGKKMD